MIQEPKRKKAVILGSTGSVGENAVRVALHLADELEVVGLAAGRNYSRLAEQAQALGCKKLVISDPLLEASLKALLPSDVQVMSGASALIELVSSDDVDIVLCSIVGTGGLMPVMEAIRHGKDIALASKEVLVMAGSQVMKAVRSHNVKMLPVDSEHSAVFQCLDGRERGSAALSRIILTASGGAFRKFSAEQLRNVTYEMALAHPTWSMGPKITVDSATLMNKALEIIEAHWLFDMQGDKIEALIHPQSVIHSMVEFIDGTILAQMSVPDMRFPIQYALTYPAKRPGGLEPLDFCRYGSLSFEKPDRNRFPSLDFAYEAMRVGSVMPAVMNAANEVAVDRFRQSQIKFTEIWTVISKTMEYFAGREKSDSIDAVIQADFEARQYAVKLSI